MRRPQARSRLAAGSGSAGLALLGLLPLAGRAQAPDRGDPPPISGPVSGAHAAGPDGRIRAAEPGDGPLLFVQSRLGYLITPDRGFTNRPFVQADGGVQLGPARVGGPPALALTLGVAVGAGEFLGEGSTLSARVLGGVELPWALAVRSLGEHPIELVPAVQVGYQNAFGEDRRDGFTVRGAVGLRIFPGAGRFFFTFEPVSVVLLPRPDPPGKRDSSRVAAELGILKMGWRF